MDNRVIVVPLLKNVQGELLLCQMSAERGVFPGQWGLPGGGIEPGETMQQALRREVREELGLEITDIEPALFKDGRHDKTFPDGERRQVYMIFLLFHCRATSEQVTLNDEHSDYAWVPIERLSEYEVNSETIATFRQLKWLEKPGRSSPNTPLW